MMAEPTRLNRAVRLLVRVARGPTTSFGAFHRTLVGDEADKEFADEYRRWSQTWIIPELQRLVPELAKMSAEELIRIKSFTD